MLPPHGLGEVLPQLLVLGVDAGLVIGLDGGGVGGVDALTLVEDPLDLFELVHDLDGVGLRVGVSAH